MEMTGSRKRPSKKGEEGGRKSRVRGEGGGGTATDAEVEEFFAILRRIHAAARYFGKGKAADQEGGTPTGECNIKIGNGRVTTTYDKDIKWRPTFESEDFDEEGGLLLGSEEGNGAVSGRAPGKGIPSTAVRREADQKTQKRAEKETRLLDYSLDLNTEPEPETHPSC